VDIEPRVLRDLAESFLTEDIGHGDVTTEAVVDPSIRGTARIEARASFVVAGLDVARACFELLDGDVKWTPVAPDGSRVGPKDVLARIDGALGPILTAERTALNLLQRLSAVATLTARFVDAVAGTRAQIIDTRKTTPGMRLLEKAAVRVGGGGNHRFGLDDGVLIKDNHIRAAGGVGEAVKRARNEAPHGLVVEVEVTTLEELDEALNAGAQAILLDNMDPATVRQAVDRVGGKAVLEASGGMDLDNVRAYAETGVDLISIGALTHSAGSVDISLEVE
jgi:nicotinate-nucleotide pyrophosphorylase (carboxylating)